MNNVPKGKIAVGYVLLLAVLLFSLSFVYREMNRLMHSDNSDVLRTDTLIALLQEKDSNTIQLLRTLSEMADPLISTREVEQLIAEQDSVITQQRVQHKTVTRSDTIFTTQKRKGFFRRLGEVFVPSKKDSAIQVQTVHEYATDTILNSYNPVDSLQEKLRTVTQQKKATNRVVQRRKQTHQHRDHVLTARIDSLLKGYEQDVLLRAREEAQYQQTIRHRSAIIIGSIAAGAVLLAILFLALIWRDITRSNRYRKELEEANKRAESLLVSREKMMLAITHDFKAPLGSIMGYAELLSRLTEDERQRFYLDNMKTSSEHLLKLVSDLLEFHRLDLHKAEINRITFYPARLLNEIRVSFEPLVFAKGLTLDYTVDPLLCETYISDPLRLRQIITNLLSNAVKFTAKGGVTLTADYIERGNINFVGSHLRLSVTDTGKGMESKDCERIFQEFTRLPGAQGEEGFGLGLSIVRKLIQLLEGKIEVTSELGKGTTFTLYIPLYPVAVGSVVATDSGMEAPKINMNHSSLRLLLIDDDRIQLAMTAAMLMQQGITSVCCQQLDELLDALRADTFDVLLTDVQMPALSGFELLTLLRASHIPQAQSIPVIAVTARSDMHREEFLAHGFAGCLHKPFTTNELLAELGIEPEENPLIKTLIYEEITHEDVCGSFNFSALTAFSADDEEAARSILESFISETKLNLDRFRQALEAESAEDIAAMAHKMLPLFTLLKATKLVNLLKELELICGVSFTEEIKQKTSLSFLLVEEILAQALLLFGSRIE